MVRIDMSEYARSTRSPLVGAPPGYVGYEQGGQLPRRYGAGRTRSCCSTSGEGHPDVFDVLLQVLDTAG